MSESPEESRDFTPRFDAAGLMPALAVDASSGAVLMLAYMNEAALRQTIKTGIAHYWSRSRACLWRKGETSGNEQRVVEMRTDCDQDALLLKVETLGDGLACHTGRKSCFYRTIVEGAGATLRLEPCE